MEKMELQMPNRETLKGDDIPANESIIANPQRDNTVTSFTVEPFQWYPTLPSDKADTEPDLAEHNTSSPNLLELRIRQLQQIQWKAVALERKLTSDKVYTEPDMADNTSNPKLMKLMMRQLQQMQLEAVALERELKNVQQKEESIDRVVAMLEKPKKHDVTLDYLKMLRAERDAGRADLRVYAELAETGESYDKKMREFTRCAPKYDGKPEKVLKWCKDLEHHLFKHKWEKIPNKSVKRMLWYCITGLTRKEIGPFYPEGLAFKECEAGVFFRELLKKVLEGKEEKRRKQECLDRKQGRDEGTSKYSFEIAGNSTRSDEMTETGKPQEKDEKEWKQECLDGKQGRDEGTSKYSFETVGNNTRSDERTETGNPQEKNEKKGKQKCLEENLNRKTGKTDGKPVSCYNSGNEELIMDSKEVTKKIAPDTFFLGKGSHNGYLETLEMNKIKYVKNSYTNVKNITESFNVKTSQPKLTGNRKHLNKPEVKGISWKEIVLSYMNETDNREKAMRENSERYQVYPEEEEEEKAVVEGKKDKVYLDWLDRVEHMFSEEEKALVYSANDRVYIDRLLSKEERNLWSEEKVMKQEEIILSLNKINSIDDEKKVMLYGKGKTLIEENKKALMSTEEKGVRVEKVQVYINRSDQASKRKTLETAGLNPAVDFDTENLVQPEVTVSYSEQEAKFATRSISQEKCPDREKHQDQEKYQEQDQQQDQEKHKNQDQQKVQEKYQDQGMYKGQDNNHQYQDKSQDQEKYQEQDKQQNLEKHKNREKYQDQGKYKDPEKNQYQDKDRDLQQHQDKHQNPKIQNEQRKHQETGEHKEKKKKYTGT